MKILNPIRPRFLRKGLSLYERDGTKVTIECIMSPSPGIYEIWALVESGTDKGSTKYYKADEHDYEENDICLELYRVNPRGKL